MKITIAKNKTLLQLLSVENILANVLGNISLEANGVDILEFFEDVETKVKKSLQKAEYEVSNCKKYTELNYLFELRHLCESILQEEIQEEFSIETDDILLDEFYVIANEDKELVHSFLLYFGIPIIRNNDEYRISSEDTISYMLNRRKFELTMNPQELLNHYVTFS